MNQKRNKICTFTIFLHGKAMIIKNISNKMAEYRTHSLFHYTKSLESILSIIASGKMYPNFCLEDLSTKVNPNFMMGIPMICFCDIPISRAGAFVTNYGKYSIAFHKDWGIKNGFNPVQYVNNEEIINGLLFYFRRWKDYQKEISTSEAFGDRAKASFLTLESHEAKDFVLGYIKKYMGDWKDIPYCNYDENEWRYVLKNGYHDIFWKESRCEYCKWRGDVKANKPDPSEELKCEGISFNVNDISHIILSSESEIEKYVKEINKISSLTKKNKNILLTKTTTFERVAHDF